MPKEATKADSVPKPMGDYSQAWTVTGAKIVFTAGQVSVDNNGGIVGKGNFAIQTRTAMENLKSVLGGVGASLRDVIKLNTYVTNITEYQRSSVAIRREYFSPDFPASTLVEVKSLASPEFLVEIEAIAAVG